MRYSWLFTLILLTSLSSIATAEEKTQDPRITSWNTLVNENGYEFKYPDCWTVRPDNPDEMDEPVTKARDIFISESKACANPLLNPPQPNGIGFSAGWDKSLLSDQEKNEIEKINKSSKSAVRSKFWLYFKRLNVGSNEGYIYVETHKQVGYTWIDWVYEFYCSGHKISFSGPSIKNPDKALLDKFKSGDIGMPEPERTIFESIRCTTPKK